MASTAWDTANSVDSQVTQRWRAIDPLLPWTVAPPRPCGTPLVVPGSGRSDGLPAAVGTCEHWAGAAGSLDLAWGAARRFQLTARVAGPDVGTALDQLLALWRDHLAHVPGTDGEDTAAVVVWPSRDISGVAPLVRRGLAPLAVVAARPAGRLPGGGQGPVPGPADAGLRIRRAGPADIGAVVRLGLEVIRFDAHFSSLIERPGTADALRRNVAGYLAGPRPWTWLAERDGRPVGLLCAEQPEAAGWIAPMVRAAPVAYLMLMFVEPSERGSGLGAALAARLHREIEAAGVAVTLLHYAQLNPLSAPFWSQQGSRPLWTSWEARPARAIR